MAKTVTVSGLAPASTIAKATNGAGWMTLSFSGTTLSVSVSANSTGAERSANVTITSSDGATATLPITQGAAVSSLTVDKTTLSLDDIGGAMSVNSNKFTITSKYTSWTIT